MFVDILTGRHPAFPNMVEYGFDEPYNNLKHITFRDTYGGDHDKTYFLQQRWNQMEIDEETPTVGSKLEEAYKLAGEDTPERRTLQRHIYELFQGSVEGTVGYAGQRTGIADHSRAGKDRRDT